MPQGEFFTQAGTGGGGGGGGLKMHRRGHIPSRLAKRQKGLKSLPGIICCVLWHGPVLEFILYLHCMFINNKKYVLST